MIRCILLAAFTISLLPQTVGSAINRTVETHAILEISEGCLIGGAQNRKWVQPDAFGKQLKGEQRFTLYTLKGPAGEISTTKIEQDFDCNGQWSVQTP